MRYLAPIPLQFVDESGVPCSGGTVSVHYAGHNTLAPIYENSYNDELVDNPVVLDSFGMWKAYVDAGFPLDYIVMNDEGNVVASFLGVVAAGGNGGGTGGVTKAYVDENDNEIRASVGNLAADVADEVDRAEAAEKAAKTEVVGGENVTVEETLAPDGHSIFEVSSSGAPQQQSNWAQQDPSEPDYIKNKPTKLSDFTDDITRQSLVESGPGYEKPVSSAAVNAGLSEKADKVQGATSGNFASLDANGNIADSGKKAADFKTKQTAVPDPPTAEGTGLSFIDSVSQDANGVITPHKKTVQDGTTAQKGVVQLNNAINSTSTTEAATPKAVKDAYDALNSKIVARAVFLSQQEWAAQSLLPGDPAKVYYVEDGTGEDAYTVYVWKASTSEYVEVDESSIDLDGYWHDGPTTTGNGNVVTGITLGNDGVPVLEKGITALTQHQDISGKLDRADVGVANGAASLDSNGDVPIEQIPDSVKDKIVYIDGTATLNTSTGVFALTVPNTTFATISIVVNTDKKLPVLRVTVNNGSSYLKLYYKGLMSNGLQQWHSFGSTDNLGDNPCTTDAKVFDNDAWVMTENIALNSKGNGSDVSVTPDGTSTGTDIGNSTTLNVWAQKFKNLVASLTNYVQKSQTSGLLKNDGSVDTNSYALASSIPSVDQTYSASSTHAQSGISVAQAVDAISKLAGTRLGNGSQSDLNDCISGSVFDRVHSYYWVYSQKDNVSNKPTDDSGQMLLMNYGNNNAIQIVITGSGVTYSRNKVVGTWTNWFNIRDASWINSGTFQAAQIPTASSVTNGDTTHVPTADAVAQAVSNRLVRTCSSLNHGAENTGNENYYKFVDCEIPDQYDNRNGTFLIVANGERKENQVLAILKVTFRSFNKVDNVISSEVGAYLYVISDPNNNFKNNKFSVHYSVTNTWMAVLELWIGCNMHYGGVSVTELNSGRRAGTQTSLWTYYSGSFTTLPSGAVTITPLRLPFCTNGTNVGSTSTPVYVNSDGQVKPCEFQVNFGTPIAGTNVLNIVT